LILVVFIFKQINVINKNLLRFPTFEKDSHEYQSRINKKFQQQQQQQQQQIQNQNLAYNANFHQMPSTIASNRGNMLPSLKPANAPFNNIERGSNIFVTSTIKPPKEEDFMHTSKLSGLISNSEKVLNDSKSDVSLLQQKRLFEQVPAEASNIGAKKQKIE